MTSSPDWRLVTSESPTEAEVSHGIELYTNYGSTSYITSSYHVAKGDWTHWRFVERAAPPPTPPPPNPHYVGDMAAFKVWWQTEWHYDHGRERAFIAGRESMRQEVRKAIVGSDPLKTVEARCRDRANGQADRGNHYNEQTWRNLARILS
jgi:hypothetical protein